MCEYSTLSHSFTHVKFRGERAGTLLETKFPASPTEARHRLVFQVTAFIRIIIYENSPRTPAELEEGHQSSDRSPDNENYKSSGNIWHRQFFCSLRRGSERSTVLGPSLFSPSDP